MIKTIYTCDRCKKDLPKREDIFEIKLTAEGGSYSHSAGKYYANTAIQSGIQWCRECLIESGMFYWKSSEVTPPETPPTLEEMIRQIVASAVEDELSNR